VKTAFNGIARDPESFHCLQVPFHESMNSRDSRSTGL